MKTKSPIPRKLNQGMIDALSEYVSKGNYAQHASYLCGIDEHTLIRWMKLGAEEMVKEEPDTENMYLRLYSSIKRARAEAQVEMIKVARDSAKQKKDGYLAITFLERTDPDNWGRKDRTRVDISETRQITITHVEVVLNEAGQAPVIEGEPRELLKEGE